MGVLLNHAERPLTLDEIRRSVERAGEVGLAALVCAGTPQEAAAAASLGPDMILAEAPGPVSYTHLDVYKRQLLSTLDSHTRL